MTIPGWQAIVNFQLHISLGDRHQKFMDKCWRYAESGADGKGGAMNNPLGCSLVMPGSTEFNPSEVQNYATRRDGINAHVATLDASEYADFVNELRKSDPDYAKVCEMIGASRWGTDPELLLTLCKQNGLA